MGEGEKKFGDIINKKSAEALYRAFQVIAVLGVGNNPFQGIGETAKDIRAVGAVQRKEFTAAELLPGEEVRDVVFLGKGIEDKEQGNRKDEDDNQRDQKGRQVFPFQFRIDPCVKGGEDVGKHHSGKQRDKEGLKQEKDQRDHRQEEENQHIFRADSRIHTFLDTIALFKCVGEKERHNVSTEYALIN